MLSALLLVGSSRPGPAPLRLAVYYGYPSLVNGSRGDLTKVVGHLSAYDLLVLGDGLEFDMPTTRHAGPAEHAFTIRVIEELRLTPRHPEIYGYIDLGATQQLSASDIADRIDRWAAMGVHGVFLDEAGYDFGVTRERQNRAVTAAHDRGITACLNAFRPADLFSDVAQPLNAAGGGNPHGVKPVIGPLDAVLLESFAIRNGVPEPVGQLASRVSAAIAGRARLGTRVFGIATGGSRADEALMAHYAWWTASAFGLDAFGWAAPTYGAASSVMPWMPRPPAESVLQRAAYTGDIRASGTTWRRATTAGVVVVDPWSLRGTLEPR